MRLDARHFARHGEAEVGIGAEIGLLQGAVERGGEQAAGDADRHAPADAELAAGPAGVDQPAIDVVALHIFAQQVAIDGGMQRQERGAEAGGEGRLRLGDALLGAGDLGGVAGQEVIHRLRGIELGDGRQHAEGVAGQHHDVLRVLGAAGGGRVRDEVQGIGDARVLGARAIVEIGRARIGVEGDVLHHRAETLGGREDLGLGLARKLDRLGVAAALEVEHAGLAPAVLVVANQGAVGIGRERGLAGAGEAEEHGRLAGFVGVGGAVHRHDVLGRQHIVEIGEHRLLHLARIGRAADQHDAAREIAGDDGGRAGAVAGGIGLEARQVDDGEIGRIGGQLFRLRTDQEVADEQGVPRQFREHAGAHAQGGIGAAVEVLRVERLAARMGQEVLVERLELLGRQRAIVVPPDLAFGLGVADDELVLRRAAGVNAGVGDERALRGDARLAIGQRDLVKLRGAEIPVNAREVSETELVGSIGRIALAGLVHARVSLAPERRSREPMRRRANAGQAAKGRLMLWDETRILKAARGIDMFAKGPRNGKRRPCGRLSP